MSLNLYFNNRSYSPVTPNASFNLGSAKKLFERSFDVLININTIKFSPIALSFNLKVNFSIMLFFISFWILRWIVLGRIFVALAMSLIEALALFRNASIILWSDASSSIELLLLFAGFGFAIVITNVH